MLIQESISLHDKNWFATGGNARFYAEPETEQDFQQALAFARGRSLDIFVLGEGANILISDQGFDGLVIRPMLKQLTFQPDAELVTAGAGVRLPDLINNCLDNGLSGLEEFSGIPGTVGGAVYINIHYFEFLLSQFLVKARVIDGQTGEVFDVDPSWFHFGYNQSKLLEKKHFLLSATFKLKPVTELEAMYAKGRRDEIIRHRQQRYPRSNTCGSFFRNFHADEIPFKINDKTIPFVAYYLDKIGVKGALRVGNATVSHQHANMIVTLPGATSSDVIELVRTMQHKVFEAYGIVPQSECQFVGFKAEPLWSAEALQQKKL
jgi:UDP-N-acetylmuramate dehydrogenase